MANNTIWQVSHYLVIVAHLIMFIGGIAIFDINVPNFGSDSANITTNTIMWAVGGVGIAGFICTALVFWRLLYLQRASPEGITKEAYYLKRKIAYISSMSLQGCLVIADIASGAAVAGKISVFVNFAAPVAFAFIAAIISVATLVTDSLQLREYSQQKNGNGNVLIEEIEMPHGGPPYGGNGYSGIR
ncbi:hypothetical protein GJ744_011698 [Endocarpon pusillum]|uniref:Uncharacterized protein n=1 Tax=Endocarpon pusillum TaxID=364733 RepID=A0A8H7AC77_9EURO|nr:hypothetical protein GJ744_011698 [Endocarpon pusillum]